MSKKKEKALVPRLRFLGFSGEWKSMPFGKAFSFQQTNTFSRNQMNTQTGKVKNIHYGDVLIKYGYILYDISIVPYVNEDVCLDKYSRESYLQNGDVVIADTAEDLTVGKALEIQNINCTILAGLHTMLCRPNEQAAPGYWGYYINSPAYHNGIIPLVTGSKVSSINKSNIVKTCVVTTDFKEQQKIADCLSSLDDLISAEKQKLETLKSYKKGLIQQLFPAEGKRIPKLRFPGYTGAWEQRKLGEVAPLRGGFAFQSEEFRKHGVPIIRISNVLSSGEVGGVFVSYDEQENDANYTLPDRAALLAMSGATTGKVSVLENPRNNKIYQNQRVGYFVDIGVVDYTFVSTLVRSNKFANMLNPTLCAGAQPNISSKDVDSFMFYFPVTIKEQAAIGSLFANLDHLITLHQRKLELLNMHKKGLMQGLFPAIEAINV